MSKSMTLESSIRRLEEIVEQIGGDASLDDAIKLYAEAVKLIDFSAKKLEDARLKVEKLSAPQSREGADEPV